MKIYRDPAGLQGIRSDVGGSIRWEEDGKDDIGSERDEREGIRYWNTGSPGGTELGMPRAAFDESSTGSGAPMTL